MQTWSCHKLTDSQMFISVYCNFWTSSWQSQAANPVAKSCHFSLPRMPYCLVPGDIGLLGSYGHLEIRPNMSVQESVHWMTIPHWKRSWLWSSIIRVIVMNFKLLFFLYCPDTKLGHHVNIKENHSTSTSVGWTEAFLVANLITMQTSVYGYKQFQLLGWALPCQQAR